MKKPRSTYEDSLARLYGLQKYGIKFGLSKTSNLLEKFGNPHVGHKYVHIAGTNGKGSVAAFLEAVLREAGLKVGLYSSPHLVRFTERFRVNGKEINRERAAELIQELEAAFVPEEPPTFFEAATALALIYFARENTDIAIMETGMGGRLDATNVITPLVTAITNISLEHEVFLGTNLRDIAGEKAGIIKRGVDLVTGATQSSVLHVFQTFAQEKEARMWRVGRNFRYRSGASGLHYYGLTRKLDRLNLGLKGKFQARNAATALGILERLEEKGVRISSRNIRDGLRDVAWPGRMHLVKKDPTVLLDGAHNPTAIRALAEAIRSDFDYDRLILVIGVMEDKKIEAMLQGIVPIADYVFFSRPIYARAAEPRILMAKAAPLNTPGEVVPVLGDALSKAEKMAQPADLVLVCGSLYTVGEAMTHFDPDTYRADKIQ